MSQKFNCKNLTTPLKILNPHQSPQQVEKIVIISHSKEFTSAENPIKLQYVPISCTMKGNETEPRLHHRQCRKMKKKKKKGLNLI